MNNVKARRVLARLSSLMLLIALILLPASGVLASGGGGQRTILTDADTANQSYNLAQVTAQTFLYGYQADVDLTYLSTTQFVTEIQIAFQYNSTAFDAPTIDSNTTDYFYGRAGSTVSCDLSVAGWVYIHIFPDTATQFTGSKPLLGLHFESYCAGDGAQYNFAFGDYYDPGNNKDFRNEATSSYSGGSTHNWRIVHFTQGGIAVPNAVACVYPELPGRTDTVYVGEKDVRSTYLIETDNCPVNQYWVKIVFPRLIWDYDSVSFIGSWSGNYPELYTIEHIVAQTGDFDTIRVEFPLGGGFLETGSTDTLFTIYYHVKSQLNSVQTAPLTGTTGAVKYNFAFGWLGEQCSGATENSCWQFLRNIVIPEYLAEFKAPYVAVPANSDVNRRNYIPIMMQNVFPVAYGYAFVGGSHYDTSLISYSIVNPDYTWSNPCFKALASMQKNVTYYGAGSTLPMYWTTSDHFTNGYVDRIVRKESDTQNENFPFHPPYYAMGVFDTVVVDPAQTTYCERTIQFYGDQNVCYVKPAFTNFTLRYGDANNSITLTSGTFKVGNPPQQSSCPYVFAWDGERFVEQNTILKSAENPAFAKPAPDYYRLKTALQPKDGQYVLQVREWEVEQSVFDAFELSVVDHPEGTLLNVGHQGAITVYRDELLPVSAIDDFGVDHAAELLSEDGNFFTSNVPGTLTLTYLPGKNFNWDLAALGEDPGGPPVCKVMDKPVAGGNPDSQSSTVITEILSANGEWIPLPDLAVRAQETNEMRTFSVAGFSHDGKIIIRVRWDNSIYVNKLSLYIPSTETWNKTEFSLIGARHASDGDVLSLLTESDEQTVSLEPGQSIELAFDAANTVPLRPGYVREFVLRASGYYTTYKGSSTLPQIYDLAQNYPNPFNPSTVIYYTLPASADVNLVVYNTLGQHVKTLVGAPQTAGKHSVEWDGTDVGGTPVSSGIYFYKLTTSDYSATRKMLLIK